MQACPTCGDRHVVEIALEVCGSDLVLRSCNACDSRWWVRDGRPSDLESVLQLTAVERRGPEAATARRSGSGLHP